MTRVLIAADETDESRHVATTAHRLFGDDAQYWLINVGIDTAGAGLMWGTAYAVSLPMVAYPPALALEDEHEALADALQRAEDTVKDSAVDAKPLGAVGEPVDAIIDAAHEHQIDVIVVGSHDRGWFSRLLDPSVAVDLGKRSDVPVLVVKSTDRTS